MEKMDTQIRDIIKEVKQTMDARGGLKAVYFVACGGSQAAIYPGKYLLDCESKTLSVKIYNSSEFVSKTPVALDGQCLVICCSLKATPETVEAVKVANNAGAVTIAMTGSADTGMAEVGKYVVVYSNGDDQIYSESNQSKSLRIGFEVLHQFEDYAHYSAAMAAYSQLDTLVEKGKVHFQPLADEFAQQYKEDEVFHILGAGPMFGTMYSMANCHLMEMQWRHAVGIHSGEYFHGPFEQTDDDLAIILLMSTGATRPLDERAKKFLESRAARHMVIDAAELGFEDVIDPAVAAYFNPVVMIPVERYIVATMAELRGHSMDERRYMWKFAY